MSNTQRLQFDTINPGLIPTVYTLSFTVGQKYQEVTGEMKSKLVMIVEGDPKASFSIVIYKALCFDVAQGRMKGVPNETRTYLCRFVSLAC